jgi:hypothetical protein
MRITKTPTLKYAFDVPRMGWLAMGGSMVEIDDD